MLTLHAVLEDGVDGNATLVAINGVLRERFGIDHATVQIERGGCAYGPGGDGHHIDRLSDANHAR